MPFSPLLSAEMVRSAALTPRRLERASELIVQSVREAKQNWEAYVRPTLDPIRLEDR